MRGLMFTRLLQVSDSRTDATTHLAKAHVFT